MKEPDSRLKEVGPRIYMTREELDKATAHCAQSEGLSRTQHLGSSRSAAHPCRQSPYGKHIVYCWFHAAVKRRSGLDEFVE